MDRRKQAQCRSCGAIYTYRSERMPKAAVCTCDSNQFKVLKE